MNPDDDDAVINQLKHPRLAFEVLPKVGVDFVRALENRKIGNKHRVHYDLQAYAEDELVRKEYNEMRCEMPGTPRSTFLMVFSPDGTKVASTHGNHNIYVTDLRSGKNIKTLVGHPRTPWCIVFHPTSNELVASGCLGGQVRIWDLSGGSEVWTADSQTVIASIAFHPSDRILVIATYNELHFWDWSKPQPFTQTATSNTKEKVRYVAFDKLGHKLITGIANTPQSRWERSRANTTQSRVERTRAPAPVADRSISPYRRRSTSRYFTTFCPNSISQPSTSNTSTARVPLSSVPERERRITACYRNLVQEYELLVHRYLQVYRPPTMMDRGTDPMEMEQQNSNSQTPDIVGSSNSSQPSTSNSICESSFTPTTTSNVSTTASPTSGDDGTSRRRLVIRNTLGVQTNTDSTTEQPKAATSKSEFKMRIKCSPRRKPILSINPNNAPLNNKLKNLKERFTQMHHYFSQNNDTISNTELRNEEAGPSGINTINGDTPTLPSAQPPYNEGDSNNNNRGSAESWRMQLKRLYPGFIKKTNKQNRKPILDTSSDNTSSEEDSVMKKRPYGSYPNSSTVDASNQPPPPAPCSSERTCRNGNACQVSTSYQRPVEKIVNLAEFVATNGSSSAIENVNNVDSICDRCGGGMNSHEDATKDARLTVENVSTNTPETPTTSTTTDTNNAQPHTSTSETPTTTAGCSRTDVQVSQSLSCVRSLLNFTTTTTNSTVHTPSNNNVSSTNTSSNLPSGRLFSQFVSTYFPPGVDDCATSLVNVHNYPPMPRYMISSLSRNSGRLGVNFAPDEVINYSERVNSEDDSTEQSSNLNEFHPFDPPPEFPSINPENIGIGNMYSNIVQDLESSLNNVRNIRASNRPGETSDMLSSFSERLESIMYQSDSILRNLRHTMDMLPPNSEQNDTRQPQRTSPALQLPSPRNVESEQNRFLFNDSNFSVRDQSNNTPTERNTNLNRNELLENFNATNQQEELYSNRSAIASDHTYPRNPEYRMSFPPASENLSPLMTSLHLTISHIQRQARLLRRQVDSIERIDRAMLEVAQLQVMRQMFSEIRRHLCSFNNGDNRNAGVSSVRQMMAGTRISDSSPCDSPAEDESISTRSNNTQPQSQTQTSTQTPTPTPTPTPTFGGASTLTPATNANPLPNASSTPNTRQRASARKSFPPSRLLHIQRQNRRFSVINVIPRRYSSRDRYMRRSFCFRAFSIRPNAVRLVNDTNRFPPDNNRAFNNTSQVNSHTLMAIIRRLDQLLTEHVRAIGRPLEVQSRDINANNTNDGRENTIIERLNTCRLRINRLLGETTITNQNQITTAVTADGISRFAARNALSTILETFTRFFDETNSTSISQSIRSQIRSVIDLTSLLSDILLLRIVESIPPPTGMNLDPERESLSARIDQMCSRILQSRLSIQSYSLTRSLRLMRLTARYASRALGQTYNARRNAIFSTSNNSRRELIGQISSTLHNINRYRSSYPTLEEMPMVVNDLPTLPMGDWLRTINALTNRYTATINQLNSSNTSNNAGDRTNRTGERPLNAHFVEVNSDGTDDNEPDLFNNNLPNDHRQLYRTNNVNLLNADSTSQNRSWDVPIVHINDIPVSEAATIMINRIHQHRYRLSELRSNPSVNIYRPRFLHPLYSGANPFDTDVDDPQREQIYDGDMILTVTPNHRIQAWDFSTGIIPDITNPLKNVVVSECKIHNDASVDISADGTILVTLLPSGGYLNVTNRLGVYSLRWESLGQCLYITSFEQNAVSVSLSPLSRHLVVGLASRRVSILPSDKWTMARIFLLNHTEVTYGSRLPVLRELEQNRDSNYMSLNCIKWLPASGQGLIYATNTGQLKILA